MKLNLGDFPVQAQCSTARIHAWPVPLFEALVACLGFGPQVKLQGSYGSTGPVVKWADYPEELTGGLLVHGTKRHKKRGEMVLVSYALFDPTGKPLSWSSDLNEDTTKKSPVELYFQRDDGEEVEIDAKVKAAIKALRGGSAKKPTTSSAASSKAAASTAGVAASSAEAAATASGTPPAGGVIRVGADLAGTLQATAFAPHGRTLFVGGEGGLDRIVSFDVATGQLRHELSFKSTVHALSVAPTGDRLIVCAQASILAAVDGNDRLTRIAALSGSCVAASWAPSGGLALVTGQKPRIVDREGKDVAKVAIPKKKLSGEACPGTFIAHCWRDDGAVLLLGLHRRFAGANAAENEFELYQCDAAGSVRATGLRRTVPWSSDYIALAPTPSRERFWLVQSSRADSSPQSPLEVTCELFDAKTLERIGDAVKCPPFAASHAATAVALDGHRVLIATHPEDQEAEIRIVDHADGTTRLLAPFVTHRATDMTAGPNGYVAFTSGSSEPGRVVTIARPG